MTAFAAPSGYRMRRNFFGEAVLDAADATSITGSQNWATANFPTIQSAMAYINSKWTAFQNIGTVIYSWQNAAQQVAVNAAAGGRADIQAQMQQVITFLGQLNVMAANMTDEVSSLKAGLTALGLDFTGTPVSSNTSSVVPMNVTSTSYASGPSEQDTSSMIVDDGYTDSSDTYDTGTSSFDTSTMLSNLGQEPTTLVAAVALAVLICGTIAYVNYQVSAQSALVTTAQQVVAQIAAGKITAAQGQQILATATKAVTTPSTTGLTGVLNSLQSLAVPLVIGAIAIFVVPDVLKTFNKGRR